MKYVFINKSNGNAVGAIVDAIDPQFPNIPIENRFSPEFLSNCVQVEDDAEVNSGMVYDFETGEFSEPEYEPVEDTGYSLTQGEIDEAYTGGVNDVG